MQFATLLLFVSCALAAPLPPVPDVGAINGSSVLPTDNGPTKIAVRDDLPLRTDLPLKLVNLNDPTDVKITARIDLPVDTSLPADKLPTSVPVGKLPLRRHDPVTHAALTAGSSAVDAANKASDATNTDVPGAINQAIPLSLQGRAFPVGAGAALGNVRTGVVTDALDVADLPLEQKRDVDCIDGEVDTEGLQFEQRDLPLADIEATASDIVIGGLDVATGTVTQVEGVAIDATSPATDALALRTARDNYEIDPSALSEEELETWCNELVQAQQIDPEAEAYFAQFCNGSN